jgi:hypothetical protein
MGWLDPIPDRWRLVLTVLLGLVLVALVVAYLLWLGPYAAGSWDLADSRERDTAILVLLVVLLMTQRRCKCSGRCGK